jgi:hypothetical protein
MAHSTVVTEIDRRTALHLRDRLYRIDQEIAKLSNERQILIQLKETLNICEACGGGGTVCDGRTLDSDMPIYNPCKNCGGRGHNRPLSNRDSNKELRQ